MAPIDVYYWPIKARSYPSMAVAQHCGIDINAITNPDLAAMKPTLPFGQLPYMVDGDIQLAQSNAILRYMGRKGGIQGSNDAEFARSEMLIEEANDLYGLIAKCNYASEGKKALYDACFAIDGPVHKQLALTEKLVTPVATNTGHFALVCFYDIIVNLIPDVLDNYPIQKALYTTTIATKAFDGIRDWGMWFAIPSE